MLTKGKGARVKEQWLTGKKQNGNKVFFLIVLLLPQVLRDLLQLLPPSASGALVSSVVHYADRGHDQATFHKTCLAWCNENDDPVSASELLQLEQRVHRDLRDGLACIKGQLDNDRLLFWITRTYSRLLH